MLYWGMTQQLVGQGTLLSFLLRIVVEIGCFTLAVIILKKISNKTILGVITAIVACITGYVFYDFHYAFRPSTAIFTHLEYVALLILLFAMIWTLFRKDTKKKTKTDA